MSDSLIQLEGFIELDRVRAVECQLFYPLFRRQICPAHPLGQLVFHPRLLRHLEKQQVSQFGDVLQVSDAIIPQDVAQVPEFLDNISRCGHKTRFWLDKN